MMRKTYHGIYSRNYHLLIKGKYPLTKLDLDGTEKQQH